ncbi:hypothetical protein Adi01nite_33120 [Amorphoplanes digitatis]|nr:hypothetical protein Adi01nite_33120 [Actinoplanes digitatis]
MGGVLGGDPRVRAVPSHDRGVAEGDVVHVEQDLVGALLVPDLPAGVARVGEDYSHGLLVGDVRRLRAHPIRGTAVRLGGRRQRRRAFLMRLPVSREHRLAQPVPGQPLDPLPADSHIHDRAIGGDDDPYRARSIFAFLVRAGPQIRCEPGHRRLGTVSARTWNVWAINCAVSDDMPAR